MRGERPPSVTMCLLRSAARAPATHHVVTRGNNQRKSTPTRIERFFSSSVAEVTTYGWQVVAYCLMRNHYHLVLRSATAACLGECELNGGYARVQSARGRATTCSATLLEPGDRRRSRPARDVPVRPPEPARSGDGPAENGCGAAIELQSVWTHRAASHNPDPSCWPSRHLSGRCGAFAARRAEAIQDASGV